MSDALPPAPLAPAPADTTRAGPGGGALKVTRRPEPRQQQTDQPLQRLEAREPAPKQAEQREPPATSPSTAESRQDASARRQRETDELRERIVRVMTETTLRREAPDAADVTIAKTRGQSERAELAGEQRAGERVRGFDRLERDIEIVKQMNLRELRSIAAAYEGPNPNEARAYELLDAAADRRQRAKSREPSGRDDLIADAAKALGTVKEWVAPEGAAPVRATLPPKLESSTRETFEIDPASRPALNAFSVRDDKYFYRSRLAFADAGKSIESYDETARTASAIVELTQRKNWRGLEVEGTAEFQRQVYIEATARGLRTSLRDYQPTSEDRELVLQRARDLGGTRTNRVAELPARQHEISDRDDRATAPTGPATTKAPRLVEFGAAPYDFRTGADKSFFVRTQADDGTQQVRWGKELEVALRRADAQVGDRVVIERTGSEAVQVDAKRKTPDGQWETRSIETFRSAFRVEVVERDREVARTPPAAALERLLREQNVPQATIDKALKAFDQAETRAATRGVEVQARGFDPNAPRQVPAPTVEPIREHSPTRSR